MYSKALDAIMEIRDTGSINEKKAILSENKDNTFLLDILTYAYDPFKKYGVNKVEPFRSPSMRHDSSNLVEFIRILDMLNARMITGDSAKASVASILSGVCKREYDIFVGILNKDLNIGIQAKTINSVIPKLISTFDVQLANTYNGVLPKEFVVQPKLDGVRCIAFTSTGGLFSRNGKQIEGFRNIENEIFSIKNGYVLDGEIVVDDFNSTASAVSKKCKDKLATHNVFDILTENEFKNKKCRLPLIDRTILMNSFIRGRYETLYPVDSIGVLTTEDQLYKVYSDLIDLGYEGAIIKDVNGLYKFKRSNDWLKLKPVRTFDLEVLSVESGNTGTKYEHKLGCLVCAFGDEEIVRVGSGISDQQRNDWWYDKNQIIGKFIEVEAQEITNNKEGTHSLRFPRLKKVRLDL